ncbi:MULTISPECIES: hypothetical protein [unclassified Streptomyces]|uniref:hypothetical protein n=1 Tax=unclassified Streptomyces TaxID=2593676 RepID=UPI00136B2383|nr:hypothetical protein [Streptomyces sp. SID6139]MYR23236.1 hypothetical protein [Streptomyces sp. SID6137]
MNSRTDRSLRDGGGGNDPEQLLDRLLAHHRSHLMSTVADALDTDTGTTALAPLRRELFHGLTPLQLTAPTASTTDDSTADDSTAESAVPLPAARLQEVLVQLRDIRLTVEKVRAGSDVSADAKTRAQTALTCLRRLHVGLQARDLTHDQVRALFRQLGEQTAYIGTSMLQLDIRLPRHVVEEWLRTSGSLQGIERTVLRLFRDADDHAPTQG